MTAYKVTPVGALGPDQQRSEVVHGPDLDLRRALSKLEEQLRTEKEKVRLALASERTAVAAMRDASKHAQTAERDAERCRDLWEYDRHLWSRDRDRLHRCAVALASLVLNHPELSEEVDGLREQIWETTC